jgi:hypothetical protein
MQLPVPLTRAAADREKIFPVDGAFFLELGWRW